MSTFVFLAFFVAPTLFVLSRDEFQSNPLCSPTPERKAKGRKVFDPFSAFCGASIMSNGLLGIPAPSISRGLGLVACRNTGVGYQLACRLSHQPGSKSTEEWCKRSLLFCDVIVNDEVEIRLPKECNRATFYQLPNGGANQMQE